MRIGLLTKSATVTYCGGDVPLLGSYQLSCIALEVVFTTGRGQHVTIPAAYRFRSSMVSIRRDPQTGDMILSEVPPLAEVFAALDAAQLPRDFLNESDRD